MFEKVLAGDKSFDARIADFEVAQGDILVLREWDPQKKAYTGREVRKKIVYVLKTKDVPFWNPADIKKYGLQIMSFSKK